MVTGWILSCYGLSCAASQSVVGHHTQGGSDSCSTNGPKSLYYKCIGARDNILDHCLSRSSAPTMPVQALVLADHVPDIAFVVGDAYC